MSVQFDRAWRYAVTRASVLLGGLAFFMASPVLAMCTVWAESGDPPSVTGQDTEDSGGREAATVRAPIRVEVSPTVADAAEYQGWVNGRQPDIEKQFPEAVGHEQWILVEIGGSTYEFELVVTPMRDGRPVGLVDGPVICDCNSSSLLEFIDARVAEAVEQLHSSREDVSEDVPPLALSPPRMRMFSSSPRAVDGSRMGPLGYTGVGVGVLGLGAIAGGIALMLRPNELRWSQGALEVGTTRSSGGAWVASGGAVVAVGIVLIVTDVVLRRRRRLRSSNALTLAN